MKISIYFFLLFSTLFLSPLYLIGQHFDCGNHEDPGKDNSDILFRSTTCDVDLDDISLKTIRVTVHVFQKTDGSGNIPNNSSGNNYVNNLIQYGASDKMNNLHLMNLSTSSPYFSDSKIRYELMNVYFCQDDALWSKGDNTFSNGSSLYNHILSQSISYKYNSIHLFIPGNASGSSGGIACGIGCLDWSLLKNVYSHYQNSGDWWTPGHYTRHELGHNLNLYHSWPTNDFCDDTPPNSNCWSGSSCSNNMMDYNSTQRALTLDQATRMHLHIFNYPSYLYSGQETEGNASFVLSNSGNNGPFTHSTVNTASTSATVSVSAPGVSEFSWNKTDGTGSHSTSSNGQILDLTNLGSIYFDLEWTENCFDYDRSMVFYNGGGYRISPNPGNGKFNVIAEKPDFTYVLNPQGKLIKKKTFINKLKIYDSYSNLIKIVLGNNSDNVYFNLDDQKRGTYNVVIFEKGPVATKQIIKI